MKIKYLVFLSTALMACKTPKKSPFNTSDPTGDHVSFERYNQFSFDTLKISENVLYGNNTTQGGKNKDLFMDVYEPENDTAKQRHLVILAHGGGFYAGDKASLKGLATYLAKSGYVVASINYRLLDVWPSPETLKFTVLNAVYDMKAAVRFFKKDAATSNHYKINPNTIYVGGYSAGAFMALNYAYVNSETEITSIGGDKMLNYLKAHNGLEGDSGHTSYDSKIKGVINISGALFNASHVNAGEPILFSIHGSKDKVVPYTSGNTNNSGIISEGSRLIHDAAEKEGLINALHTIPEGTHRAYRLCDSCNELIRDFLFQNL